jgi:PAS domain S-box-containing protein
MSDRKHVPQSREHLQEKIRQMNEEISTLRSQISWFKNQKKELNEKKGAYRAILEDLPDLICRFNPDGIITYANSAYCNYVNKPFDDIMGTSIFSYIPGDEKNQMKNHLESLSTDCPVRTIDYRAVLPGRQPRWQQWTLRALFDDTGSVTEFLSAGRDISNLKHVENGLIDALEKYSTIFESSNDAILLQDGDCILDCNTAALRIFRCREKELFLNKHYTDFSARQQPDGEDSEMKAQKHIKRALKRGMERFQWMCRRMDGSVFPSDVILSPLNMEGKTIIAAVVRDISDQKQTEKALKKSEEKYRELVENINDAIFSLDADGTITYISPAIRKISGYTPDELMGKHFTKFVYPEDMDFLIKRYNELLAGKIMPLEYRLERKNGNPCWVRTYSRPISEGNSQKLFGIITDISKQKKAEADLKKAYDKLEEMVKERTLDLRSANKHLKNEIQEREKAETQLRKSEEGHKLIAQELRIVLNGITDLIILCDNDLNIVWANNAAAESLDKPSEELTHQKCYDLWHNRHIPNEESPAWRTIHSGQINEGIQETPDGSIWEVRAHPLIDEHGIIRGAIEISRNVTERKILEEELQKRQRLESLGTLAGGIAHDFNNILTVVLGNVSFAKMLMNTDDKAYARLSDVENAALKAKELAGQLLSFSRGESPLKKIVSIDSFLHDTITLALKRSDIISKFSFTENLWPVEIDESQIAQVINNIINNAEDAMPHGGTLTIGGENISSDTADNLPLPKGRYVKICIADTGIGIENENINNIFDPFFTTKKQSYGLGLATSYSMIKKHEGYITATSQAGKGTSIVIYLPASSKTEITQVSELEEMHMGKGNILFMDDEEFIRDLAKSILSHLGYTVTFAKNGEEAIEEYTKARKLGKAFDAVILDLTIPEGMGGKDCIRKLKEIDTEVKAIVSSGYSDDPAMKTPEKFGFMAVIAKPYNIQTLSSVLLKTISGSA